MKNENKSVFYIGFKEFFHIDLAKKLLKNKNFLPIYWTANDQHEKLIKKNFPNIFFQKNLFAVRGYIEKEFEKEFEKFNSKLISNKLSKIRRISNYMLERFNWNGSFSDMEKKVLTEHLIKYSEFLVEYLKPDIVFFNEVPHFVYDYILYEICKIKKIKTLIFAYSNITGYSFVIDNIWTTSKKLDFLYKKKISNSIDNLNLNFFKKEYMRIKDQTLTQPPSELWVQNKIKINNSNLNFIKKIKNLYFSNFKQTFENINKIFRSNKTTNASNMKIKNINFKKFPSYLRIFINIKISEYKTNKLKIFYKKICEKKPDLTKNYINFFLHYEPERSISPQAGLLYDQFKLAIYFAENLPKNWFLYVKEHRKTFNTHFLMRNQYRSKQDYINLLKNKNIILVDDEYPSLELIKHAKANITSNGTAGLESIIHLRPLLTFGYSWLNKFKYCFSIRTKKKILKIIKLLLNDKIIFNENDVKIFLKSFEEASYNMYHVSSLKYEETPNSEEKNINNLYNSIIDYHDNWMIYK